MSDLASTCHNTQNSANVCYNFETQIQENRNYLDPKIRKIIFRSKWRCIKGAKFPIKITPDRVTKITKVVDD